MTTRIIERLSFGPSADLTRQPDQAGTRDRGGADRQATKISFTSPAITLRQTA